MRYVKWPVQAIVLLSVLLAACSNQSTTRSAAPPVPVLVSHTDAWPDSIVATGAEVWFSYSTIINRHTGVGHIQDGKLTEVLYQKPSDDFEVDQVFIARHGAIWYSAFNGKNNTGYLGTVTLAGLNERITLPEVPDSDIAYDHSRDRFFFGLENPNRYGWIDRTNHIVICGPSRPAKGERPIGATVVATSRGIVWVFDYHTSSVFRLGEGCRHSKPVPLLLGGDHADVPAMVVDDNGTLWMLDRHDEEIITVDGAGQVTIVTPPVNAHFTGIGILSGHVCVAGDKPTFIACSWGRKWVTQMLAVRGPVSGMALQGRMVWLAYPGLDGEEIGAIAKMPFDLLIPRK